MKKQSQNDFSRTKLQLTQTSQKLIELLNKAFSGSELSPGLNFKVLQSLMKYTNRLASDISFNPNKMDPENLDHEQLLAYSLYLIANTQASIINQNPKISTTNLLAISNLAKAFGVPVTDDSDSLLTSISLKFKIDDPYRIGDELTERLLCVPRIITYFGLDKKDPQLLFDPDNLCEVIQKKCEDSSFLDRIISLLNLPPQSTESSVIKFLTKKLSLEDQKQEIEVLKKQNDELRNKLNERKARSLLDSPRKQDQIDYNLELEYTKKKNTELQEYSSKLETELQSLKKKVAELEKETKNPLQNLRELRNTNKLLENQIESQSHEIQEIMKNRKDLLLLIRKQSQILAQYDRVISSKPSPQTPPTVRNLRSIQSPPVDDKIFDVIADAIENAPPDVVDGVLKITKSAKYTKTEKVKKIILFFINEIRKQRQSVTVDKVNKGECERLVTAMHSQLRFLENLVSCDDDINLLFEEPDEARKAIQEQVIRIEQFLKQNARGFVEDANIFDSLQLNANPLELSKRLQSFLDRYPTIRTPEGDELFVMLRMSLAANGILRRFAITTRNQAEKQMSDIRGLTNELEKIKAERERSTGYMLQQINEEAGRREAAEQNLRQVKLLLKSSSGKLNNNQTLCDFIDKISIENADADEYQLNLEQQLSQALQELSKAQAQIEASKDVPIQDESLHEELQQQIEKQLNEIDQLMEKINALTDQIDKLNQQLASSQFKNDKLSKELSELKDKYNAKIKQLKKDMNEKMAQEAASINKTENEKCEMLKQTIDKMKESRKVLKASLAEKDALIKKLNDDLEIQKDSYARLDELLRLTQKNQMSTQYEYKLLQKKVQLLEEKNEENSFTNEYDDDDNNAEAIIARMKEKHQEFLSQIYSIMAKYFDESILINDNAVIKMLMAVKAKIKELKSKNSTVLKELNQIRIKYGEL